MATDPQPTAPATMADPNPSAVPSVPSVDLSALAGPGAAAPTAMGSQEGQQYTAAVQGENAALASAKQLAQPQAPAAPVPHARLLAMVQGLALGVNAAATSLATHGREGGAAQVAQVQGEQQAQEIAKQQAEAAKRNTQIQQQLMIADTNHKLAQNIMLLATMPNEIAASDLKLKGEKAGLATGEAEFRGAHGGMSAEEFNNALGETNPAGGSSASPSGGYFATSAAQQLEVASQVLGPSNQYVQNLQSVVGNPAATAKDLYLATQRVQTELGLHKEGVAALRADEEAKAAARPKSLDDATGRVADADKNFKANPNPQTQQALTDAKSAQNAFLDEEKRKKEMEQDVQSGDPAVVAQALFSSAAAPSQVLSARSFSKPFYSKVMAEANKLAKAAGFPEIKDPSGKGTGEYFNLATAEAKYQKAHNVQTQNTMDKMVTLNEKGGDFDILSDAASALPKMDEQTLNKMFNATATEFGSPTAARYHMALYNLAGLLSQVQTGSIPTEGEIQQQLNLMSASFSKGQLEATLQTARRDVAARAMAVRGNNPYLKAMYPIETVVGRPAGASDKAILMQVPGGDPHWIEPGPNMDAARKLGATEVQ